MQNIFSYTPEELVSLMAEIGEPKFRAGQIFSQLHRGKNLDEMTNIGKATKEKISAECHTELPKIKRKLISKLDGTVKYLFELYDKNCVESVVMKYEHGYTICVSSQVGCRMGCKFCASTIAGRVRDLEAGEILGQILAANRDLDIRISNVVMMGIGEPLDNFDNTVKFLKLVNHPDGVNIGYRHISVSTCGVVDKIYKLAVALDPLLDVAFHAGQHALHIKLPVQHGKIIGAADTGNVLIALTAISHTVVALGDGQGIFECQSFGVDYAHLVRLDIAP